MLPEGVLTSQIERISNIITVSLSHNIKTDNTRSNIIYLCFKRIISDYNASLLLVNNGYFQQTGALTRSALETLFVMTAAHQDNGFIDKYITNIDSNSIKQFLSGFDNACSRSEEYTISLVDDPEFMHNIESLRKYLLDHKPQNLNFSEVAKEGQIPRHYDSYYKFLSTFHAHPTPRSLDRLVVKSPGGTISDLPLGEATPDIYPILMILFEVILDALNCFMLTFSIHNEGETESIREHIQSTLAQLHRG